MLWSSCLYWNGWRWDSVVCTKWRSIIFPCLVIECLLASTTYRGAWMYPCRSLQENVFSVEHLQWVQETGLLPHLSILAWESHLSVAFPGWRAARGEQEEVGLCCSAFPQKHKLAPNVGRHTVQPPVPGKLACPSVCSEWRGAKFISNRSRHDSSLVSITYLWWWQL